MNAHMTKDSRKIWQDKKIDAMRQSTINEAYKKELKDKVC